MPSRAFDRALAGLAGNTDAVIITTCFHASLVGIADSIVVPDDHAQLQVCTAP